MLPDATLFSIGQLPRAEIHLTVVPPDQEYNERRSAHGVLTRSMGTKAAAQATGLDVQPLEYPRIGGEGDSYEDAITGSYGRIGVWLFVGSAIEQQTWYVAH